jgi:hypothetical protein
MKKRKVQQHARKRAGVLSLSLSLFFEGKEKMKIQQHARKRKYSSE